jgi:anti-anti-sigma regulatory factor
VSIQPVDALDMATVPVVEVRLSQQQAAGVKHVTLDLRDVRFVDSTGLRMILVWDARARADGFAFSLVAGPPTPPADLRPQPARPSGSTSTTRLLHAMRPSRTTR